MPATVEPQRVWKLGVSNDSSIRASSADSVSVSTETGQHGEKTSVTSDVMKPSYSWASVRVLTITVNDFIKDLFSRLSEVSYICIEQDGDVFDVTIALSNHDDDAMDRVLGFQQQVMDEFSYMSFDFNVIFQERRAISDLIYPSEPLYQRT
jgi:hypothetical protein